jgi:hypothetical protein
MTSPDGINWTARVPAADNLWLCVCWAPELSLFVSVAADGTGNRVMTSPDGITWTARTSANENQWWGVCWSPELSIFVGVAAYTGSGNRVMTSAIGMPNSKSVVKALPSQMMVDANGNVGIGTTNPVAALHINSSSISLGPTIGGILPQNFINYGTIVPTGPSFYERTYTFCRIGSFLFLGGYSPFTGQSSGTFNFALSTLGLTGQGNNAAIMSRQGDYLTGGIDVTSTHLRVFFSGANASAPNYTSVRLIITLGFSAA